MQSIKITPHNIKSFFDKTTCDNNAHLCLIKEKCKNLVEIINEENRRAKYKANVDQNENQEEKVWRRLSLQSLKRRRERKQAEKSRPMIPEVLKTYDKTYRVQNRREWL